jgi:hypothetical protein
VGMDAEQQKALAQQLYDRRREGVPVSFEKVSLGDREPERGKCHDNVDAWVVLHPADSAVRGWLVEDAEAFGFVKFVAHSVVERDGKLIDITYPDGGYAFIRHIGETDEFMGLVRLNIGEIRHVSDPELYALIFAGDTHHAADWSLEEDDTEGGPVLY